MGVEVILFFFALAHWHFFRLIWWTCTISVLRKFIKVKVLKKLGSILTHVHTYTHPKPKWTKTFFRVSVVFSFLTAPVNAVSPHWIHSEFYWGQLISGFVESSPMQKHMDSLQAHHLLILLGGRQLPCHHSLQPDVEMRQWSGCSVLPLCKSSATNEQTSMMRLPFDGGDTLLIRQQVRTL